MGRLQGEPLLTVHMFSPRDELKAERDQKAAGEFCRLQVAG